MRLVIMQGKRPSLAENGYLSYNNLLGMELHGDDPHLLHETLVLAGPSRPLSRRYLCFCLSGSDSQPMGLPKRSSGNSH